MWFEHLMGFEEISPEYVRQNLQLTGTTLFSKINGKSYDTGTLEIPSLETLRSRLTPDLNTATGTIQVRQVIDDVNNIHLNPNNENIVVQAASQFNLLEMTSPEVTPEAGISNYIYDKTQGPACAIACGAGTIYRHYLVDVNGKTGQSKDHQIDCLDVLALHWNNGELDLWKMKNGYAMASRDGLAYITQLINQATDEEYHQLLGKLKVGIQWQSQVTSNDAQHKLTQVYCSGLPVGYSSHDAILWQPFAKLILCATYEATFFAAWQNYLKTNNPNVYLTLVGGGVFGNNINWITYAIKRALIQFRSTPLKVHIVSYRSNNPMIDYMIESFQKELKFMNE